MNNEAMTLINNDALRFIDTVWANVRARTILSPADGEAVKECIGRLYRKGFSIRDATLFCECLEEIDPTLDEDWALKRMAGLEAKYKAPTPVKTGGQTKDAVFSVWAFGDRDRDPVVAHVSMDLGGDPQAPWIATIKESLSCAFSEIWNIDNDKVNVTTEDDFRNPER